MYLSVFAVEGSAYQKEGSSLLCLAVVRVESRRGNPVAHKPYVFCQDNLGDTQPLLAAFLAQGYRLPPLRWQQQSRLPSFYQNSHLTPWATCLPSTPISA